MSLERADDHDHDAWLEEKDLTPVEHTFLTVLIWLDRRLRLVDYLELLETMYYRINFQLPKSHTEQYNLDNKFWYWYPLYALGSFSTLAYIVAAVSGALLGFYYAPSAATGACASSMGGSIDGATVAYCSITNIMTELNFGYMLRSIHRWAAQVMTAAVFLHMLRVYFTGAYKEPRELNWLIGIVLISLTMVFGYTGYLLPWDQLSYWASQIGVEMSLSIPLAGEWIAQLVFGGFSPGAATLRRMYILHVFLLPFVVTTLIAVHIGIVWMQGIAEPH
ncbi:MAG: cytochrome bc complex cytochrome b subunit [Halobacteriaceae archaeon]